MRRSSDPESEHSVDTSERIILKCGGCGERLILLGLEEDWYREGRTSFRCGGCGRDVTLASRIEEGDPVLEDLLRKIRTSYHNR